MAPAQQEQKLQETFEELALAKAIQQQRICTVEIDDLKEVLRYAIMKIGLRAGNWPTEEEKLLLINHVIVNYGNHTVAEIRLAFDMAITGKLDVEVNCFENFSCMYFSSIMNAYRAWSTQAHKHIASSKPVQKIYTAEELWSFQREDMENAYQRMKMGRQNVIPKNMKEVLVKDGFITEETDLAKWLVEQIAKNVKNLYVPV